jgi:hypothetical protein
VSFQHLVWLLRESSCLRTRVFEVLDRIRVCGGGGETRAGEVSGLVTRVCDVVERWTPEEVVPHGQGVFVARLLTRLTNCLLEAWVECGPPLGSGAILQWVFLLTARTCALLAAAGGTPVSNMELVGVVLALARALTLALPHRRSGALGPGNALLHATMATLCSAQTLWLRHSTYAMEFVGVGGGVVLVELTEAGVATGGGFSVKALALPLAKMVVASPFVFSGRDLAHRVGALCKGALCEAPWLGWPTGPTQVLLRALSALGVCMGPLHRGSWRRTEVDTPLGEEDLSRTLMWLHKAQGGTGVDPSTKPLAATAMKDLGLHVPRAVSPTLVTQLFRGKKRPRAAASVEVPHPPQTDVGGVSCAVCLDTAPACVGPSAPTRPTAPDRPRLPCSHVFHTSCLVSWVCVSVTAQCPLCKRDMFCVPGASDWALSRVLPREGGGTPCLP